MSSSYGGPGFSYTDTNFSTYIVYICVGVCECETGSHEHSTCLSSRVQHSMWILLQLPRSAMCLKHARAMYLAPLCYCMGVPCILHSASLALTLLFSTWRYTDQGWLERNGGSLVHQQRRCGGAHRILSERSLQQACTLSHPWWCAPVPTCLAVVTMTTAHQHNTWVKSLFPLCPFPHLALLLSCTTLLNFCTRYTPLFLPPVSYPTNRLTLSIFVHNPSIKH